MLLLPTYKRKLHYDNYDNKFYYYLHPNLRFVLGDLGREPIRFLYFGFERIHQRDTWFVGFLDLERLTCQLPAVFLEKITLYEAVHRFKGVQDLKGYIGYGHRVFALMIKPLPTEPFVLV